jgi:putative flavoprotein involved in K+ transport
MTEHYDVVVIGAGQAGLSIGYYLSKFDIEFVILEQGSTIIPNWRKRWDSFTLVLPNWTYQIPDHSYNEGDPDGFMNRDELVEHLEEFAASFDPEIRFDTKVTSIDKNPSDNNFLVNTNGSSMIADNVVVAAGTFQEPRIPYFSKNLSSDFVQMHTHDYRNPEALPDGGVLVVGTGQSGCQIAEELYQSGRKVYLCVGGATRVPRRYRGKDTIWWLRELNFFDQTADTLTTSKERFKANPFVSGKNGGHSLNLHQFAQDGVVLLGHMKNAEDNMVYLTPDLHENLAKIDNFVADLKENIDKLILKKNIDAELEPSRIEMMNGYDAEIIDELDLKAEGIKTIIWATGYKFNFSWIGYPILDKDGYPIQERGISEYPGLYFLGLHFMHRRKSGLLWGVGEDAEHIANDIAARRQYANG